MNNGKSIMSEYMSLEKPPKIQPYLEGICIDEMMIN